MFVRLSSIPFLQAIGLKHRKIAQFLTLILSSWFLSKLIFLHRQLPITVFELGQWVDRQPSNTIAGQPTVLVTGVAGFLGYSAALLLLRANLSKVIGIDSFLSYEGSPLLELKYKRADRLSHYRNINISKGNVCEPSLLQRLFQSNDFTHILYFSSEEGKEEKSEEESSTTHEDSRGVYGKRNKPLAPADLCFLTLLEELRAMKKVTPRLIFESSSIFMRIKRAHNWEKLAALYSVQYGLSSIAWKFPIVFGPFGDPSVLSLLLDCQTGEKIPTPKYPGKMAICDDGFAHIQDVMSQLPSVMKIQSPYDEVYPSTVSSMIDKSVNDNRRGLNRSLEWILYDSGIKHLCVSGCLPDYGFKTPCIATSFDKAAQTSASLSQGCDTVVYTVAFTGKYGRPIQLHEPRHELSGGPHVAASCYFAFVDRPILPKERNGSKWVLIQVQSRTDEEDFLIDNRRKGKFLKFHPLKFFAPSVSQAIYIDAKLRLLAEPREMVRTLRSPSMYGKQVVLVAVRHPLNEDPFKEGADIRFLKAKYRREISFTLWTMELQLQKYYQDMQTRDLPLNNMIDSAILIHDMKKVEGRDFRCAWSREYYGRADRDQLSFPWVLASKVRESGAPNLVPRQEWCPLGGQNMAYVRILPDDQYHWWRTRVWAVDLGLAFVNQPPLERDEAKALA